MRSDHHAGLSIGSRGLFKKDGSKDGGRVLLRHLRNSQ